MLSVLLFILSFVLVIIFAPLGLIFTTMRALYINDIHIIKDYYKKLALSLDQFGNVVMSGLFNIIFINDVEHLFGNEDETISSVLGKNKLNESLTWLGQALDWILNKLDKNHSIKSIEGDEQLNN